MYQLRTIPLFWGIKVGGGVTTYSECYFCTDRRALASVAHQAAMEGQLPCLKFLVAEGPSTTHILGARNDNGETPKMLAQQFYKEQVVEYVSNIEWERDHPEESESESVKLSSVWWTLRSLFSVCFIVTGRPRGSLVGRGVATLSHQATPGPGSQGRESSLKMSLETISAK